MTDTIIEVETSIRARRLAQTIAHFIWENYSDEFGYKSEKQTRNKAVNPKDPDSLVFYFGQFDVINQLRFIRELGQMRKSKSKDELVAWIKQYFEWYNKGNLPKENKSLNN